MGCPKGVSSNLILDHVSTDYGPSQIPGTARGADASNDAALGQHLPDLPQSLLYGGYRLAAAAQIHGARWIAIPTDQSEFRCNRANINTKVEIHPASLGSVGQGTGERLSQRLNRAEGGCHLRLGFV